MKAGASNKKTLFTNWLAVALACMVLLLCTQSEAEFFKTRDGKLIGNREQVNKHKTQHSNNERQRSNVGYKIAGIAILNSSDPVFQVREDFRFVLNPSVNQAITLIESIGDRIPDRYKIPSFYSFSIPIFHCKLLI